MRLKQFMFALTAMLLSFLSVNAQEGIVAKIGNSEYTTFANAMTDANAATGNVTVEVYGAVEFIDGMELNGSYTAITFTGMSTGAKITINQTAGGDYLTAHGKTVAFNDLILAKANPAWSGNSGHMGNYFSIQGGTVTYTYCTFPNGACTSTGTAVYNNCTFQNASEYGLWVYDDALVTVNGGTIDSTKGIKVYSEGEDSVTSTLTVQNATFTENVTAKPAVAVGYAQSITLIGNTYNNTTAHVELDSGSDADCDGIAFVAEDSEGNDISSELTVVDRSNSSAACGVLVDGKIYTTVTTAAAEATSGSTVTLLYSTTETVELPEGVTLDTNGFTADNVTVEVSLAGEGTEASPYLISSVADLETLRNKVNAGNSYEGQFVKLAADLTLTEAWTPIGNGTRSSKSYSGNAFKGTFDGGNKTISGLKITSTTGNDAAIGLFGVVDGGTVKNLTLNDVDINVANSNLAGGAIGLMLGGATAENITVNGEIVGNDGVGGIVGRLVINGTIKDCTNNASVTSSYGGIGGIVGKAYYEDSANTSIFASIDNCTNNGTVTAPMYVGGIVGLARANVTDCVNNGPVVGGTQTGGIIGQLIAAGTVSGNENKAKITGKNHLGGIIGDYSQSSAYTYYNVAITSNINRGELAATEQCAAIMGCNNIDGFTAMTATGNVSYYFVEGLELFGNPEDMVIDDTNKFISPVAKIGDVEYETLAEAVAVAEAGDEIVLLGDVTEDVTLPAGITFNGNGKTVNGTLMAGGNLTLVGHTKATNFNAGYNKPIITIGEGACLELTGTGRMVIGHGATFNITGSIEDAKTADVATLAPSLIIPGASFTGAGVTFNVTNAYISAPSSYCSSSKSASGTFDFNFTNSIWESAGKLAFESQSTAATVNFDLVNSVLNTGSHLVFGVSRGEVVIDNSNVNVGTTRQIENQSTMTIKNGSVVNGAVATSSNAKNPGTIIVENATYAVTGEFSGSDLGTGTLIVKKGATVSAGSITKANIQIDATGMAAGDEVNLTANLSNLEGSLTVVNNNLDASIVDGKIVLAVKPVAKIGETAYSTLEEAISAAQAGDVVKVFEGTYAVPAMKAGITIVGEGNVLFEGTLSGTLENLTLKNLHIKGGNAQRWAYAKGDLVFENVTFEATSVYALHFDGITEGTNLTYKNCTIIGWAAMSGSPASCVFDGCTIKDNGTYGVIRTYFDATIENCTFDVANANTSDVYQDGIHAVSGAEITVNGCTNVNGEMKDLVNVSGASVVTVDGVEIKNVAQVGETKYTDLQEALDAAAQAGETVTLIADVNENVTVAENVTIDGAGKNYTGTMTVNTSLTVTIHNVNFVKGSIAENKGTKGNLTIKGCTFDGDNGIGYAITVKGAEKLTIENSTAKNYSYGMLYIPSAVASISVKDVAVENVTAAFNITYSGNGTFENVTVKNAKYGLNAQNHGSRIFTLKNWTLENVTGEAFRVQEEGTAKVTFRFEGCTEVPVLPSSEYAIIEGATVDGTNYYGSVQGMVEKAVTGQTVKLLSDIAMTEADCVAGADHKVLVDVAGKDITLDMNGKTISVVHEDEFTNDYIVAVVRVADGAGLTVTGEGTIDVKTHDLNPDIAYMFWKRGTTGHLTIKNGTYKMNDSADSMVYTNGNEIVTIEGGTWELGAYGTRENGQPWIFNVQGAGDNHVIVKGGTFNADINRQHWSNEVLVPETYYTVANADSTAFTVNEGAKAYVNEGMLTGPYFVRKNIGYPTFVDAVAGVDNNETITLLDDATLEAPVAIEKDSITINLNEKTVTGADGAVVFNINADATIKNGTILGNKSGTTSGLIDIYANLAMDGVTLETSKINALRFKVGDCTATLDNCNITGAFKGYGSSVWAINSGTYKAASTAINDQLNGTAQISGGTFHYEITDEECAPGYSVVDNGDGTYTVKYAPVCFVDTNNNGTLDEGETVYGSLAAVFNTIKEGDVYIVLTSNTAIAEQVDTDANAKYYLNTNVAEGVTVDFTFADDWNYVQKMYVGKGVTLNAPYLLAWTDLEVHGTINTGYLYTTVANVVIAEGGVVNATTGDATVQVKNGAKLTVNGELNTSTLNVWVGESKLIVSGDNAKVNAKWVDIWDGTPVVDVENGATLAVENIKASRGGSIEVSDATLAATGTIELGHNGESTGTLTETGNSTITGNIKLTVEGSTVKSDGGLTNVTTDLVGYGVVYENGEYKVVALPVIAKIGDVEYYSLQEALNAAAAGTGDVTVTILSDVDLTDVDWNPVTVSAPGYPVVTVDGNNKTITGLNDMLFAGTWAGKSGLIIKDLTIANSSIVNDKDDAAGTVGVGAFIGFPQASATITLENCHLKNSSVEGGHWTGGLIGYAAGYAGNDGPVFMNLTVKGCSVTGSTITGKGSVGGIIGHGSGNGWTNVVIEETTVKDNTITSTGSSNVKAGAVMGTIGAAGQPTTANGVTKTGGASVSATVAGNTVTSNGTTITTIYGRQGTETGMLYVAGGSYDNYPIEQGVAYAAPIEGYEIVQNTDGTYGIQKIPAYVAKIGEQGYETLAAALAAAQDDDVVTLLADVETADGIVITDKNLVIDLNGKTYTTTEGASTNNRNFKIEGTSVVTIKNGTMVAAGDYSSGAYGTVRTEGSANVTLEGLKLYNYRGNGLNIKACGSSVVTINDTEIYSNYGGGIESAGGTIEIANVKVEQKGMYTAPYNSMAISVNGGGKVTVNSGTFSTECITAEEANNQGTSHGPWVAGVLNSGGTLIINGGTFSNDNFGENSLATYARGAILADTKAKVEINGGKFNVLKNVIDIQNNLGDANNNPSVVLAGGTYNADPRISASYSSNLITLADGYVALPDLNGNYVVGVKPTATVNNLGMTTVAAGDYMVYGNGDNTADMPLSFVMQFLADQTEADMATSPYAEWYGDFVITFTGLENGSFTADGCYLAGHYGSFGWVKVPVDGMTIEEGARYPVMLGVGMGQKYDYICSSVQDFKCALYLTPEILEANPNIQVKLELAVVDNSKGSDDAASALINNENVYSVTEYTYDAEDFVVDPNYIAEFTIDDAARVDYVNDTDKTVGTLTYKRTLAEGAWNPLYLPFQVDVAQLADNYDIAYYNQMLSSDSNNDGAFDSYIMEVAYITSGTLKANYPYFIRPKTSDDCYLEYVANDVTLCAAKETVIVTSSVANTFKLHGTHKTVSAADLAGCYTIKASGWVQTTIDLRPHRLYLEILENDNSPFVPAAAKSIRIVVRGEDGYTGVEEITGENGEEMIFDLQGRRVLEPEKGGMYIINGKKVIY